MHTVLHLCYRLRFVLLVFAPMPRAKQHVLLAPSLDFPVGFPLQSPSLALPQPWLPLAPHHLPAHPPSSHRGLRMDGYPAPVAKLDW